MKAITLTQPWATLVAIGAKAVVTKSWQTSYRGPIAIHAAKSLHSVGGERELKSLCGSSPFYEVLSEYAKSHFANTSLKEMAENPMMPFGSVIAVAELESIQATDTIANSLSLQEIAFGDYSYERYAWVLSNVVKLPRPVEAKGQLGLWNWMGEIR